MANEILTKTGIQFLFRDPTDFDTSAPFVPATVGNSLILTAANPTEVDIDLTGVAASGGARESDKTDLTTPRAARWTVDACLEFESAPADNGVVEFYWAASPITTAATGNPGGLTGTDADFTDTAGILGQFQFIGVLTLRNNAINIGHVGIFSPVFQFGILAIVNKGSIALRSTATAMDETHIVMTEIIDEVQ